MILHKFKPLSEMWLFRSFHNAKIRLCRWLLVTLEPDVDKIIGESIEQAIDDKSREWEIALLSIQAEIAEEFDGELLGKVSTVPALCEKIRQETRAWRLQNVRERKLVRMLGVDKAGEILPRVRGLLHIDSLRERERVLFDHAMIEARRAKNSFNQMWVLFYELQRSFDLEYRVRNVLEFEEDYRKELK